MNGITAINTLADTHNFEVTRQQNSNKITENTLLEFDAVIFLNTTANIFDDGEQAAFEKFIRS